MACIAALALLFGTFAGSAWAEDKTVTINATVRSQDQITQAESDAGVTSGDTVSYEINVESDPGVSSRDTTITIGNEENNVTQNISITANGSFGDGILVEGGTVTFNAVDSNTVTATTGIYSNPQGNSTSTVTLNAVESNTVRGTYDGIDSTAALTGISTVTLDAEGSNTVSGNRYGIQSSVSVDGTSTVNLYAGESNTVSGDYGILSYIAENATSTVNLYAGTSNQISGNSYGIYSDAFTYGTSTITLVAASNTITANETTGTAIHSGTDNTVNVTGTTTLTAATGAEAISGGKIYLNSDVTANTDTVATADGSGSEIYFYDGLSNEGYDSIISAFNDGAVTVNANGTGIVNYTGTTSIVDENNPSGTYGTIDMYLTSGSTWHMTGDSIATSLIINNGGQLDMTAETDVDNKFSTLTLDTLTGTGGLISMDIGTNGADEYNNSDIIETDDFIGTQSVNLVSTSGSEVSDNAIGTVLMLTNGDGTLSIDDVEQTLFYKRWLLESRDSSTDYETEWYLASILNVDPNEKPTTTVSSVMSAASLNYHSWMMQNTKLLQRLGDLRQGGYSGDNGAWFRISGSKLELGGQHGFENEYIQYEVGYDKIVAQNSQFTMYGGLAITYADGDSTYNRGDGDNESKAVSLYFTQINKGGSYLDVVFKLGRWENDFKVYDTASNRITGETESTGISLSAEYGKKFVLGNRGLYIEPQAQLTYGHFDGDSYTLSNGVNVHSEGIESLVGRAGFNLGWDIDPRSNVYLKANVLYEFLGDYAIVMNDGINTPLSRTGDYSDTWFLYGLGASFKLGKQNSGNFLHFDVERSTGGDLDQEWFYNVGFRFEM